jgi:glycosyltransferase involved in cell wall biosynthesis
LPDVEKGAEVRGAAATTRVKIMIPAHDEAAVVDRCLSAVLGSARPGEFDVVVISNGSTDDTVQRARDAGARLEHEVEVVEIPTASKIAALRAADDLLVDFPDAIRLFLDADVILSTHAARMLVEALDTPEPRLAVAKLDVDTTASSWLVRRYYRAWTALPYVENQVAGSGVFAMNGAGAMRVGQWPDVINDDGYVARCFDADQRVLVDATFRAFAAHSLSALVRRRARIVNGNRQLDAMLPQTLANATTPSGQNGIGALVAAVRARKTDWLSGLVFATVTVSARALAAWRRTTGATARWSTDRTTRQAAS